MPRGRVTLFPNWCKGCNLCVEFCPTQVLEQSEDGYVTVAHSERCTACRWCELHCPDFAIFVQELPSGDDDADAASGEETSEVPLADDASKDDVSKDDASKDDAS
jgi:2-oxoglutarate ferredoxin oxidoreductase subunit delta